MELEKYLDSIQIENIKPEDTIILNFNKWCDLEKGKEIFEIFKNFFPYNNITCTHYYGGLESIGVIKDEL